MTQISGKRWNVALKRLEDVEEERDMTEVGALNAAMIVEFGVQTTVATQLATSRPGLAGILAQAEADMTVEEARAQVVQDEADAMLAAIAADPVLQANPTGIQLRAAVMLLSGRIKTLAEHTRSAAKGHKASCGRFRKVMALVSNLAGLPVPTVQGFAPSGAQSGKRKS